MRESGCPVGAIWIAWHLSPSSDTQKTTYCLLRGSARTQRAGKVGSRGTCSTSTRGPEKRPSGSRSRSTTFRSVRLPMAVDASKVTATFRNGVLVVTLPKTPAAKGTMIPVKAE